MIKKRIRLIVLAAAGLAAPLLLVVVASRWYGSTAAAWDAAIGRSLHVERSVVHFGDAKANERFPVNFRIKNLTGQPIRLVGAATSCGCVRPNDMPITISPWAVADFTVRVRPAKPEQDFMQRVKIYTNVPSDPLLELTLIGNIRS